MVSRRREPFHGAAEKQRRQFVFVGLAI